MHRASGPEAFRPVGETEFVNGVAAMSASGGYGAAKICAGIVGHVDLRNGAGSRAVLEALLDKYADEGIAAVEDTKVLRLRPFDAIGTPLEIIKGTFGGKAGYEEALSELEHQIYDQASNK